MFSKLARLAPAVQRGFTRQLTPAVAVRAFHSSKPVANTVTVEERNGPKGTIVDTPGILDQYGYIPFIGLLGTALVSKEVFIIDEAFLLALNTITVCTVTYIGFGRELDAYCEATRTKDNERYHDVFNAVLEQVNLYKSIEAKKLEKVGVIKDLCKQSREVNANYLKFLDVKQKHDARAAMISKLQAIKKREAQEDALEYQEMISDALQTVRDSYTDSSNTALHQASLEFAIKSIGDVKEPETDPVKIELEKVIKELASEE